MNIRIARGIYLILWAAALTGLVLAATRAGLSIYGAVLIAWVLSYSVLRTIGYILRSRKLRREGKQPPNYLLYLVVPPRPLSSPVLVPRPVQVLLAVIVLAAGALCLLVGISAIPDIVATLSPSQAPVPTGKILATAFFIPFGIACWCVGARLIQLRSNAEHLLPLKDDNGGTSA